MTNNPDPNTGKLDPRGPNKFVPEKHEVFPDQGNYPEKPGRKPRKPQKKKT